MKNAKEIIITIVVIAFFIILPVVISSCGQNIYDSGYKQGYVDGIQASEEDDQAIDEELINLKEENAALYEGIRTMRQSVLELGNDKWILESELQRVYAKEGGVPVYSAIYNGKNGKKDSPEQPKEKTQQKSKQAAKPAEYVWLSKTGKSYHKTNTCGNIDQDTAYQVPVNTAIACHFDRCDNCW